MYMICPECVKMKQGEVLCGVCFSEQNALDRMRKETAEAEALAESAAQRAEAAVEKKERARLAEALSLGMPEGEGNTGPLWRRKEGHG